MTTPPDGSDGGNTSAQLLVAVGALQRDVAVILSKLDILPDHENRIRAIERSLNRALGAGIAAGVLSGGIATLITWALTRGH